MDHFINPDRITETFAYCLKSGLIKPDDDTSIVFYDFDQLKQKTKLLKQAFPENTLHTSAVKANPLIKVLEKVKDFNLGAEVASEGELRLVIKTGFSNDNIVFDSPAKTFQELEFALRNNIRINSDSFMELDRISKIKETLSSNSKIGLRINPQVGYGSIEATSVAGEYSKFGIPLKNHLNEILDYFLKYNWLSGIHMHIGSQGCNADLLINGFELGLKLIKEINQSIKNQDRKLEFIDIGGGLPVSYHHNLTPPDIKDYGNRIKNMFGLYELGNMQLITEFGRFLHANSGFILSKVEYAKHYNESNTIIIHSGADILLRECLNPGNWFHEFSVLNKEGKVKKSINTKKYHIAGPLCFANDIVARNVELPQVDEGDYIVIHDTGAYTFGMWSKYLSRPFPKVIGFDNSNYKIIRNRESFDEIIKFWT
ncbi:MAG TPA: diaminopimelate decarboxylase [Bacteroidales bacterium]|nr:diaminopimelate decarboxylase [Bacteroidales bacterium]